jgi:sporulation protein YlmC with PRC-barrel domain
MESPALSLDLDIRGKRVFLSKTLLEIGFVDDVIVDPTFGILAITVQGSRYGTWAFPYMHVQILRDGITVAEHGKHSPRRFLRAGRSYQDLLGLPVLASEGSPVGRIRDIDLADLRTGEIAYRVSPPGIRSLWSPDVMIHAPTAVVAERRDGIVLRGDPRLYEGNEYGKAVRDENARSRSHRGSGSSTVEQHV